MKTKYALLLGIALLALMCQAASTPAAEPAPPAASLVGTWESICNFSGLPMKFQTTMKPDGSYVTICECEMEVLGTRVCSVVKEKGKYSFSDGVITSTATERGGLPVWEAPGQASVRWITNDMIVVKGGGLELTWSRK